MPPTPRGDGRSSARRCTTGPFPLFRYRTGDLTVAVPGRCPCGRAFPLIGAVEGRAEELVYASDGRPIPLAATVVDDLAGLREVQLVQQRPGVFEILMVPGPGFSLTALEAKARRNLERLVGADQQLEVRVVDRIPRPQGAKLHPVRVMR